MSGLDDEKLIEEIIGAAYEVRKRLAQGYLESTYENALIVELQMRGLFVENQVSMEVDYKGVVVGVFKADLLVEKRVIIEIKAVSEKYGCIYTVYVDDMTFSSINPFPEKKMVCEIDCILRKYGHKPKYKKVKYYTQGRYVPITGTVVTGRHELKVPSKLQKRVYDDFQEVKKYQGMSLSDAQQKKINSLRGRIQASENIENGKFPEIKRLTNMIGQV